MRKVVGMFFAVAMLAPIGISAAPSAAATVTAGTTCKSMSGTGMFSPTLPKLNSSAKVRSVLNATGSVASCSGSVNSGSVKFVSTRSAPENCKTLGVPPTVPIKGTETITWNNGMSSTIAFKLAEIPGTPVVNQALTGSVTGGLFKGRSQKGKLVYAPLGGGCIGNGLSKITYSSTASMTIK
jgi:hypothetical protein